LAKEFVDIEGLALAAVQRPDAFVDIAAECAQLVDMRQELETALFLIGIGRSATFTKACSSVLTMTSI
jgi:hypothetical protein